MVYTSFYNSFYNKFSSILNNETTVIMFNNNIPQSVIKPTIKIQ